MEYQRRLKFIEYIKKNFIVQKDETIAFHFKNYDDLNLVTAQKIKTVDENSEYHTTRKELKLGVCIICDTFGDGPYIDFYDDYLNYSEIIAINHCLNNSLTESVQRSKAEIRDELAKFVKELNGGERPAYRKSNC